MKKKTYLTPSIRFSKPIMRPLLYSASGDGSTISGNAGGSGGSNNDSNSDDNNAKGSWGDCWE